MKKEWQYTQTHTLLLEESCLPPLQSGEYVLTSSQETDLLGAGLPVEMTFFVNGPRFSLSDGDVASVYPPPGMLGSFGGDLPQITFRRKTLPWERALEPEKVLRCGGKSNTVPLHERPWMALLCLRDGESVQVQTQTAGEAITPPDGTYFPHLTLMDSEQKEMCRFLDMDMAFFQNLIPYPDELALLCHGRKVERTNTVCLSSEEEDWVSILVGNRLPASSEAGSVNHIYLVSLEGFGNYTDKSPAEFPRIRLLVLYDWKFTSITEPRTFLESVKSLSCTRIHAEMPASDSCFIPNGYYPLEHHFRNGAASVSLYRGPLVPAEPERKDIRAFTADGLYRYLPEIGIFDVSYAAAWQLGLLEALNSPSIAEKLMKAKECNHQEALRMGQQNALRSHIHSSGASETLTEALLQMLEEKEELT